MNKRNFMVEAVMVVIALLKNIWEKSSF